MAAGWPTLADVQRVLRVAPDPDDDAYLSQCLAAGIIWTQNRTATKWWCEWDPNYCGFVPDPLFWDAMAEAARLVRRRDSVDGTIGWGDLGVVRVGPKDPDIETMIAPYLAIVV